MNSDLTPFLRHALVDELAQEILQHISQLDRDFLLLWKAFVKRMKPVPPIVMVAAIQAYGYGAETVGVRIQDANDEALVMDKLGDLLWNALDESVRREWLLKVT